MDKQIARIECSDCLEKQKQIRNCTHLFGQINIVDYLIIGFFGFDGYTKRFCESDAAYALSKVLFMVPTMIVTCRG